MAEGANAAAATAPDFATTASDLRGWIFVDEAAAFAEKRSVSRNPRGEFLPAPRAALAFGLWRGFQFWRKRRAAQRIAAAAISEL